MSTKRKNSIPDEMEEPKKSKPSGHWATGLLTVMEDPECLIQEDDQVAVIRDKYPKAEHHFLVLPKEDVGSLKDVETKHLELLRHMHTVGEKLSAQYEGSTFKLGYHAEASMYRLHLHVVSDDMNSACVKTKKHWNSFNTDFFLDSTDVCNIVEKEGRVSLPSKDACKKLLDTPLKCHKCDFVPKHMPDLKKHIFKHVKE